MPCVLTLPLGRVSLFATLTTFGASRDIGLDELPDEMSCPMDEATDTLWRRTAANSGLDRAWPL
jgi:hypothetical protein